LGTQELVSKMLPQAARFPVQPMSTRTGELCGITSVYSPMPSGGTSRACALPSAWPRGASWGNQVYPPSTLHAFCRAQSFSRRLDAERLLARRWRRRACTVLSTRLSA
jgi:hypothetical protein